MSKWTGSFSLIAVLLSLVLQVCLGQVWQMQELATVVLQEEKGHPVSPQALRVLASGHLQSVVDWRWLQILIHAPQVQKRASDQSQLFYDLHLLSDLDEWLREVYIYGAHLVSLMYFDTEGAVHLLQKGLEQQEKIMNHAPSQGIQYQWKMHWEIPVLLGYFYFFELDSMEEAAHYFQLASQFQEAPVFVKNLGQKLSKPLGKYRVGLSILSFMLNASKNEELTEQLNRKKENLEKILFMANLNLEFQEYQKKKHLPVQRAWERYGQGGRDPWGGNLFLDQSGKIMTSTPHGQVFGLHEYP